MATNWRRLCAGLLDEVTHESTTTCLIREMLEQTEKTTPNLPLPKPKFEDFFKATLNKVNTAFNMPIPEHELEQQWDSQTDELKWWWELSLDEQLAWAQTRAVAADRAQRGDAPAPLEPRATTTPKTQTPTDADLYDLAAEYTGDPVPAMRSALALWGRPAVAQPEPEELTDKELKRLAWNIHAEAKDDTTCGDVVVRVCRAAIAADRARYGRPAVAPVAVSERITSIATAVQKCAFGWKPTAKLIGNVCAEDVADLCSAILPTPPTFNS
jgi:hypothetical protein